MSLIIRETIEEHAVQTVKEIQSHTILHGYQQEEQIKQLVQPLVDTIVKITQKDKQQVIDEYMGKHEDKEEDDKKDKLLAELKATVADTVIVHVNKRRKVTATKYSLHRFKMIEDDCVDEITYDDLLEYPDPDDKYYDDFRAKVKVTCSPELEHLIDANEEDFIQHIKNTCKSVKDVIDLTITVDEAGILKYSYYLSGIKRVCEIIDGGFSTTTTNKRKRDN